MKLYEITFNHTNAEFVAMYQPHQRARIVMMEAFGRRAFVFMLSHDKPHARLFHEGEVFDFDRYCKYVARNTSWHAIDSEVHVGLSNQVKAFLMHCGTFNWFLEQTNGELNVTEITDPAQRAWFRRWGYPLYGKLLEIIEHPMPSGALSRRFMQFIRDTYENGRTAMRLVRTGSKMDDFERRGVLIYREQRKELAEVVRQAIKDDDPSDFDEYVLENDNPTIRAAFDTIKDALESKGVYSDVVKCDCGHLEYSIQTHEVEGDTWCDSCFDADAVYCEDTNDYCHRDNAYWSDNHDAYYSYDIDSEEEDDEDEDGDSLMDYSTNVMRILDADPAIKSSQHGDFLMGIELEMVSGNDVGTHPAVEDIRNQLGESYCVCKRDGSLPDNGLEIVTAPRGLAEHIRTFKQWEINPSYRAWDVGQCGMHIHIDSRAFSAMTLGKFIMFINHTDNADFIRKIAGRHPMRDRQAEHYCAAEFQESLDNPAKAVKGKSYERYRMVNLQNLRAGESQRLGFGDRFDEGKYNTVELRIFRASLKKERLLAQIEFTHAAVMFCRVASYRDLTGASFIKWLKNKTNNTYPHLSDWYGVRRREGAKNAAPTQQACTDVVPEPEPRPAEEAVVAAINMTFDLAYTECVRTRNFIPPYVPVTTPPPPPTQREMYQLEMQIAMREAELAARRGNNVQRVAWRQRAQECHRLITALDRQLQLLATTI